MKAASSFRRPLLAYLVDGLGVRVAKMNGDLKRPLHDLPLDPKPKEMACLGYFFRCRNNAPSSGVGEKGESWVMSSAFTS